MEDPVRCERSVGMGALKHPSALEGPELPVPDISCSPGEVKAEQDRLKGMCETRIKGVKGYASMSHNSLQRGASVAGRQKWKKCAFERPESYS